MNLPNTWRGEEVGEGDYEADRQLSSIKFAKPNDYLFPVQKCLSDYLHNTFVKRRIELYRGSALVRLGNCPVRSYLTTVIRAMVILRRVVNSGQSTYNV
jgi:hypothetical protein